MLEATTSALPFAPDYGHCTVKRAALLIEPMRHKKTGEAVLGPLPGVVLFVLQPSDTLHPAPGQVLDANFWQFRPARKSMLKYPFMGHGCPSSCFLALRWRACILRDGAHGMTPFDQFRVSLGSAPNILWRWLKALAYAGVLEKRPYRERPPRDEYGLTNAGVGFLPILAAIGEWGRTHNGGGALSHIDDTATGETVQAMVVDGRTGQPARLENWRVVMPAETRTNPA